MQAALRAYVNVCERWSKSGEAYRVGMANKDFPGQLKAVCGTEGAGNGLYGHYPFPTKRRPGHADGDWTMELSIDKRPKCKAAIYNKGKLVASRAWNIYIPLEKRLLINGDQLRSGWDEDDLLQAMMYNLKLAFDDRAEQVKGEAAGTAGEGVRPELVTGRLELVNRRLRLARRRRARRRLGPPATRCPITRTCTRATPTGRSATRRRRRRSSRRGIIRQEG